MTPSCSTDRQVNQALSLSIVRHSIATNNKVSAESDGCSVPTHATSPAQSCHGHRSTAAAVDVEAARHVADAWQVPGRVRPVLLQLQKLETRKDTGCVNTLLISYGICRQVCDWSKWWARGSVCGEISIQLTQVTPASLLALLDVDNWRNIQAAHNSSVSSTIH